MTTTTAKPIALILGSGPRIGGAVAARYKQLGYEVAVVSRRGPATPTKSAEAEGGYLQIGADLADTSAYAGIYGALKTAFPDGNGVPDVVFFNAASLTPPAEEGNSK